jgi:chitin synthase
VSWGTKGSDKAEALPSVQTKKDKHDSTAVAEVSEKAQEDVDSAFEATVKRAIAPFKSNEEEEKPTVDDQNKTFRS